VNAGVTRLAPRWLALREPADAQARARDLVERLAHALPPSRCRVIHDLGCGAGAMGRWLGPLLAGRQHWILHDRDPDLLALAAADPPGPAADGAPITIEVRHADLARADPRDFAEANLVTASALLDLLTENELERLAGLCAGTGSPTLLTLSVTGCVGLAPWDPLDCRVAAAFDAHQRRTTNRGRLLGPDAVGFAVEAFGALGADVLLRRSAWRLGRPHSRLVAEWLEGWVDAACEQDEELGERCEPYLRRRLAQAGAGTLEVTVGHADLLVLP
jgi:hypothetical protein